jgi:hypothetical protein
VNPIFSVGIQSLWDELRHMPAGGVWWISTDRNDDAISLMNQTIAAQDKGAKVAVITMGEDPKKIIRLNETHGPDKVRLFSMPQKKIVYTFCPAIFSAVLTLSII